MLVDPRQSAWSPDEQLGSELEYGRRAKAACGACIPGSPTITRASQRGAFHPILNRRAELVAMWRDVVDVNRLRDDELMPVASASQVDTSVRGIESVHAGHYELVVDHSVGRDCLFLQRYFVR